MDQPGKVANSSRGQLNRGNEYSPVPVGAWEFYLARRVQPSRPASACSFSILKLNLVLTHGIPPEFRGGVHLFIKTAIRHRVTQSRTDGVHCRESAGKGPVNLKVVAVTGAAILQVTMDQWMCRLLFPHPLLVYKRHIIRGFEMVLFLSPLFYGVVGGDHLPSSHSRCGITEFTGELWVSAGNWKQLLSPLSRPPIPHEGWGFF